MSPASYRAAPPRVGEHHLTLFRGRPLTTWSDRSRRRPARAADTDRRPPAQGTDTDRRPPPTGTGTGTGTTDRRPPPTGTADRRPPTADQGCPWRAAPAGGTDHRREAPVGAATPPTPRSAGPAGPAPRPRARAPTGTGNLEPPSTHHHRPAVTLVRRAAAPAGPRTACGPAGARATPRTPGRTQGSRGAGPRGRGRLHRAAAAGAGPERRRAELRQAPTAADRGRRRQLAGCGPGGSWTVMIRWHGSVPAPR